MQSLFCSDQSGGVAMAPPPIQIGSDTTLAVAYSGIAAKFGRPIEKSSLNIAKTKADRVLAHRIAAQPLARPMGLLPNE